MSTIQKRKKIKKEKKIIKLAGCLLAALLCILVISGVAISIGKNKNNNQNSEGNTQVDNEEEYEWVYDSGISPIFVDVSYKIRKNNGSFRLGVDSDTAKPQLYIMYKSGKTYKIINIVDYAPIYL